MLCILIYLPYLWPRTSHALKASHISKNVNVKRRQAVFGYCHLKYHQFDFLKVSFTQLYLTSCFLHQLIYQVHPALSEVVEAQFSPAQPLVNQECHLVVRECHFCTQEHRRWGTKKGCREHFAFCSNLHICYGKKTNLLLSKYDFESLSSHTDKK